MRKNFFILFVAFICVFELVRADIINEKFNNEESLYAVRKIAQIKGVCEAAVICRGNKAIAGVRLDMPVDESKVYSRALTAVKTSLPRAKHIVVEVETDKAYDIIELSYCIDTDMKKSVLKRRFNYLFQR